MALCQLRTRPLSFEMTDGTRRVVIFLPWLSVPLMAALYFAVWDRLPARLAVHFNSSGAADGWMSRETMLAVSLGILLFVLAQYTWKLWREAGPNASRSVFVIYYAAIGIVTTVFLAILKFNL